MLVSRDFCFLLQILEHQTFTINILAKFYAKHTGLKLETDLFLEIRTETVYFVDFRTIFIHILKVIPSFSKCLSISFFFKHFILDINVKSTVLALKELMEKVR